MSSGASPDAGGTKGPPVADQEDLQRALTYNKWWVEEEQRVSSAAFSFPDFSVDIASIAGSEDYTIRRFASGTGLVVLNCGAVRGEGCHACKEKDQNHPDNEAHANAYMPTSGGHRKRAAKAIAEKHCKKVIKPDIAAGATHPEPPT